MARLHGKFPITILREAGVIFEGRCDALIVPSSRGEIAILAHHTPMIAKLSSGVVIVKNGRSKQTVATIETGVLHVGENEATVLLDL